MGLLLHSDNYQHNSSKDAEEFLLCLVKVTWTNFLRAVEEWIFIYRKADKLESGIVWYNTKEKA